MGTRITQPGDSDYSRQVTLGINKSMIVELDNPAADVVITNPDIADAVVQTSKRIIFRGVKGAGQCRRGIRPIEPLRLEGCPLHHRIDFKLEEDL